ncbi:MAG: protein translocase subunit SecD [Nitrospinota bacterium]|nr:MAG: protein translocase subunit SecD [Nitrospinota bacterium]
MRKDLQWKTALIVIVIGVAVWYNFPPGKNLNLGLDLQGGVHLLLEVEADKVVESALERYQFELESAFKEEKLPLQAVRIEGGNTNRLILQFTEKVDPAKVDEVLASYPLLRRVSSQDNRFVYQIDSQRVEEMKSKAVEQALETIRNRVDQFGVAEPTIQRKGERGIIVELPGIKDTDRAIQLIGKTARLEFRLVDDENSLEEALKGKVPEGDEILYRRVVDKETRTVSKEPFLLKKQVLLTGDALTDARMQIGSRFNEPYVSLSFDKEGAKLFERITAENVGKRLAIVLDNTVYSAPVIRERIGGGRAQITGLFTIEEARDLAIVLRAGALPAPVRIEENRTVGPSLGADSIRQGITAILVGGILVLIFMIIYYRLSGVIADVALFLNLVLLTGALAYFHATLTLPGIAGILLTIGMAVDANVLIFERIREELRVGKTIRAAVDAGFSKAFLTIVDANVTTVIAALVLFQFGTGPVKGFAVTLSLGIAASMFTAVFVSRVIFEHILSRRKVSQLSI